MRSGTELSQFLRFFLPTLIEIFTLLYLSIGTPVTIY